MTAFSQLNDEERKEYWAALALRNTPGLGVRSISSLLRRFGSAYQAFMNRLRWAETVPHMKQTASSSDDAWRAGAKPEWDAARKMDAEIILWTDEFYPDLLRHIPDAPALLYAKGSLSLLKGPAVAIVGSRACSPAAADIAARMAEELSASGITVVSGMAAGADASAQKAALKQTGRSIAVLGTGIDVIYPSANFRLYEELSRTGLILTEIPPHTKAQPGAFPARNRIISGISLGLLVAEAVSSKSGSLITASLAGEQGRNVYVPAPDLFHGNVREGTKKLIEDGAMQIYRADDIIADLFPHLAKARNSSRNLQPDETAKEPPELSMDSLDEALIEQPGDEPPKEDAPDDEALHRRIEDEEFRKTPLAPLPQRPIITVPKAPSVPMTEEETAILGVLKKGPVSADDLLYAAREHCPGINWSAQSLNAVLMILEVKKLARRLPDSRYEAAR